MIELEGTAIVYAGRETNFDIREFVPPTLFGRYKHRPDKLLWFIRPSTIISTIKLREYYAVPVTVNNWHIGGILKNRGWRFPGSTVGSRLSQHKAGMAIDYNVKYLTAEEVYASVRANQQDFIDMGWTTVEAVHYTPSWSHLDARHTGFDDIYIVTPA